MNNVTDAIGPRGAEPARPWPADQAERWPLERMIPYAKNARVHSEADLDKLAAVIRRWGWAMPVLADEEGNLLAATGALLRLREQGEVRYGDRRSRLERGEKMRCAARRRRKRPRRSLLEGVVLEPTFLD
jgi:uncharacterized protein with von Willebrand factor type A (vWA) domain